MSAHIFLVLEHIDGYEANFPIRVFATREEAETHVKNYGTGEWQIWEKVMHTPETAAQAIAKERQSYTPYGSSIT